MTVHSPDLGRSDCDETGHSRVKVSGVDDDSFECPIFKRGISSVRNSHVLSVRRRHESTLEET